MGKRRNPAVVCGLAGAFALASPVLAQADVLEDLSSSLLYTPGAAYFAAGALAGALVGGGVSGLVCHALLRRDAKRRAEAEAQREVAVEAPAAASEAAPAIDGVEQKSHRPRHMRVEGAPAEKPVVKAVAQSAVEVAAEKPLAEPVAEPAAPAAPESAPAAPAPRVKNRHEATDYEDVAAKYVGKAPLRERKKTRAKGVASMLRERMGASMMEGLPVISRPDGSVADVGTSWWNTSVGLASITKVEDIIATGDTGSLAIPSDFTASGKERLVEAAKNSSAEFAKKDISERLAFVDEGEYPEVRDASDNIADDVWASALRSMDERLNAQYGADVMAIPQAFLDVVGDADTLDEPDGLELPTSFIPFKTPAGHPEVVDTETYVDYLIGEEMGNNSSNAVRRNAGRFLRVLEGGTGTAELDRAKRRSASSTASLRAVEGSRPYAPKHFAVQLAAEA